MVPSPAVVIVAHPGHELRLHHWLELAKPRLFVITDGSGSGRSRLQATLDVLQAIGCEAGSVFGRFTDREIYRLLLSGDAAPVAEVTLDLAAALVEHDVRSVVADAFELYNPTHDLCSVVARLAAEQAELAGGWTIARYEYAVTRAPRRDGESFALDDAALARKLAAAHRCEELKSEVDNLIAAVGIDALRREVLVPVASDVSLPPPATKPHYEVHGEKRVAAGQYATVIRYEKHFRPFAERLAAAVRTTGVVPYAARS